MTKKNFYTLLKIIIAAGLLVFIIIKVKPGEILNAVERANILFIVIAVVLLIPNLYLQYWKWKKTCTLFLDESGGRKIFFSLLYGLSGGVFTPARVGEYFGRSIGFKDKSFIKVSAATLVDKLFPLVILLVFGSITGILFLRIYFKVSVYITLILFAIDAALLILIYLSAVKKGWRKNFLFGFIKSKLKPGSVWSNLKILKNMNKKYSSGMIFISILFYLCVLVQFALLVAAFTHHYNFLNYLWAGNLVMFTKSLIPSVTFSDVGVREGASIYFLTKMGETSAAAFDASIFLFLINVLLPALLGMLLLFKKNK